MGGLLVHMQWSSLEKFPVVRGGILFSIVIVYASHHNAHNGLAICYCRVMLS